jgi:hypothetical protein
MVDILEGFEEFYLIIKRDYVLEKMNFCKGVKKFRVIRFVEGVKICTRQSHEEVTPLSS